MIEELTLDNYGCIIETIPNNILSLLLNESLVLEKRNSTMTSGLSGSGVTKHYYMNDENLQIFLDYILTLKNKYLTKYPSYLSEFRFLSDNVPFACDKPWFNIQRKGEFTPNHIHDGVLSYSAWLKIPYDLAEETKDGKYASCFEFTHSTITASSTSKLLPIDKTWEGKIMMFPSKLMHCVYPFHTVDDVRISLSGNILFDTYNARINS